MVQYHLDGIIPCWPLTEILWEIMNSLSLVFHPFANIYLYSVKFQNIWFFSIWIQLVQKIAIGYSVSLEYSVNTVSVSHIDNEGKIKFMAVTQRWVCWTWKSLPVIALLSSTTKCDQPVSIMNLVTPKAGAKHELLFNKPASVVTLSHVMLGVVIVSVVAPFCRDVNDDEKKFYWHR